MFLGFDQAIYKQKDKSTKSCQKTKGTKKIATKSGNRVRNRRQQSTKRTNVANFYYVNIITFYNKIINFTNLHKIQYIFI